MAWAFIVLGWAGSARAQEISGPPSSSPSLPGTHLVPVHVDSPSEVDVEMRRGGRWEVVCVSPCDRSLSSDEEYRIGGADVRASKSFHVAEASRVTLEVEPTSSSSHAAAVVVTVIGAAGFVPAIAVTFGVVVVVVVTGLFCGLFARDASSYGGCVGSSALAVGQAYASPMVWIPAAAGVAMIAAGGAWMGATPPTGVNQVSVPGTAPSYVQREPPGWNEATRIGAPVVSFPVVDLRF